jgi:phosphate transport system substrate-binding protein
MNDEFLHELRTPPSPAFAARLKRQLDSKAAVAASRKTYWLLGLVAVSILGSTAVAFVLPARNAVAVIIQRIAGAPNAPATPEQTEPSSVATDAPSPFASSASQASTGGVREASAASATTSSASVAASSGASGATTGTGSIEPSVIPRSSNLIARDARLLTTVAAAKELQPLVDGVSRELARSTAPVDVVIRNVPDSSTALLELCAGKSEVAFSDRPMAAAEIDACKKSGVGFVEMPIAYDAAVIVVNPQNKWADSITTSELKAAWKSYGQDHVPLWYDLRPVWPTLPLALVGRPAEDHARGEDEAAVTMRVANDFGGLGSVSYGQYVKHTAELRAVAVVNGAGNAILPSGQSVRDGSYEPLTRRIFMYGRIAGFGSPAARLFVSVATSQETWFRQSSGYLMLNEADYQLAWQKYSRAPPVARR